MGNGLNTLNFSANGRYSANEAIDNFILGPGLASKYKHKFISDSACPCCDMENKIIYSPVLPAIINNEMDKIIRGKNEHEAGHGRFTPANKKPEWSKAKCNLINALEDERIENGVKAMSKAFESDIDFLNRFMVDKINTNWITNGCQAKAVDEAIMALHIKSMGFSPLWNVTPFADKLINSANDIYTEIKNVTCKSEREFNKVENIADRILAVWEKMQNDNSDGADSTDNQQNDDDKSSDNNSDGSNGDDNTDNSGADSNNADGNNDTDSTDDNSGADNADNSGDGDDNTDNSGDNKSSKKSSDNKNSGDNSGDIDLDDFCDDNDIAEQILEKELQKMIKDTKDDFGEYTAYTAEDEIIKATKDKSRFDTAYQDIAGAISMLASHLEQSLRTQSRCRNIGNRDRGYLDRNALPMLAKNLTKNVFYTTRQGISLDTTVSILIDESGSMYGSNINACRSMAIAIAEVLERLNIKFEILGHTTGHAPIKIVSNERKLFCRHTTMRIFEHKNFNESYRNEKYRLGSISSYGCNIDGEALLTTFKRAIEQKSNRHIILVLSDGLPSGAERGGERHLTNTVNFCRKNGVEVYGFGIGTNEPERFYGKDYFIYLPSINDLNGQFFRQFSTIITQGKIGR